MTPPQRAFSSMVPGGGSDAMAKMLPSVPDMDTQIALAAKMIDKRTSTPKGSHSYAIPLEWMFSCQSFLQQELSGCPCREQRAASSPLRRYPRPAPWRRRRAGAASFSAAHHTFSLVEVNQAIKA